MKILIYLNFYDKVKVVFEGKCVVLNILLFFKREKKDYVKAIIKFLKVNRIMGIIKIKIKLIRK